MNMILDVAMPTDIIKRSLFSPLGIGIAVACCLVIAGIIAFVIIKKKK